MNKITELTKEQELAIPEFLNKWINKAHEPMDENDARTAVRDIYKSMKEDEPLIIIGDSPMQTALLASLFFTLTNSDESSERLDSQLRSQLGSQLDSQLYSQLRSQLGSQLDSQLDSQLGSQLDSQLDSQLYSQLGSQLDSQLGSQLDSQLDSQLYSQLRSQLGSQLDSQLYSQLGSQLDSQLDSQLGSQLGSQLDSQLREVNNGWYMGVWWLSWCGWYDYAKFIGVKFENASYDLFMRFNSSVNFIIPYKGIAFISHKPEEINWQDGKLHMDGGLAVKYKDGNGLYSLNGVTVDEHLACTPEGDLDIDYFNNQKSADIRTEFVRKYGIERMLDHGKKIDSYDKYGDEWWSKSQYELYDMESLFKGADYAPHLKMTNQTTGVYHVEPVHPSCRTIFDAVKDRFGGEELEILNIA
jgi:hypothetical protein